MTGLRRVAAPQWGWRHDRATDPCALQELQLAKQGGHDVLCPMQRMAPEPLTGWHQYAEGDACPRCFLAALEREMVDVGVCVIPGPWHCLDCGWQESEPFEPEIELDEDAGL